MVGTTEAFSRVKIDALLAGAGWDLTDGTSVLFEHALGDGSRADYVLCDRAGRPMAVVEAKRASVDPIAAQNQGRHYAEQLEVPFVFLSNDNEVWFLDRDADAHARAIATFCSQEDLERRIAARSVRRALADVPIDRRIVDRRYQVDCVDTLSDEVTHGRRKLLVEMATGTGKTRAAAAFIKRLFEAGAVTRVLFLVDRTVLDDGFTGKDGVKRYPSRGKTIVFAVTKRHAETLAKMFDEHFADLKPYSTTRYADFVVSDLGGGPSPDASTIIKRFKDEEFPQILVSVNMLDTGFDCPEVVNLVMARFTRSAVLYRQMRGRGTRKAPYIRKADFTMFDFVGVTDYHGDDEGPIPGDVVREPPAPPLRSGADWTIECDPGLLPLLNGPWYVVTHSLPVQNQRMGINGLQLTA